jgi:hypothetical protein
MSRSELQSLIEDLHRRGLHDRAAAVDDLGHAVDALERPPGIVGRVTARARDEAARQWRLAVDEWGESREALRLLRERLGGRRLAPEEADAVRHQAFDFLRSVPAGVLTAASALVPLPGFMLLTPWMLSRLGLLPSRWREDAILEQLREEARELRERGEDAGARQVERLAEKVADRRELRDELQRRATVRTYWDLDEDGHVSAEEQAAYDDEVDRLVGAVSEVGPARRWYLMLGDEVIGPVRFGEALDAVPELPLLLCLDGQSGWVRLGDVRTRGGFAPHAEPGD